MAIRNLATALSEYVRRLHAAIHHNNVTQRAPVLPGSQAIYGDPNSSHQTLYSPTPT